MNIFGKIFGFGASASSPVPATESSSFSGAEVKGGNWFNGTGKAAAAEPEQRIVYSKKGTPRHLSAEYELTNGGEGVIYRLPDSDRILIKIYKKNILGDPKKRLRLRERLNDMLRVKLDGNSCLAWPRAAVFDDRGEAIGFAMNKCTGKSFLALGGGVESVRRVFPKWDRSHLALAALDFVRKIRFLAMHGVIVNDFNPANFLVNENCEVSFIDCDSFQIPKRGGGVHITKTFFASYVAPELLREPSLLAQPRNIHHVEFGAAMIVFYLLMYGLHPYAYYDPFRKSSCGTPDENLRNGRCPLGKGSDCRFPQGNWYNLWSWLTGALKGCLIRTFKDGHSDPLQRTPLEELEKALQQLIYEMNRPATIDAAGYSANRRSLSPYLAKPRGDRQADGESGGAPPQSAPRMHRSQGGTASRRTFV